MKKQGSVYEKGACKICGRYGHEEAVCYEMIGYPTGWGSRGRGRRSRGKRNSKQSRGAGKVIGRGSNWEMATTAIHAEAMLGPGASARTSPANGLKSEGDSNNFCQPSPLFLG